MISRLYLAFLKHKAFDEVVATNHRLILELRQARHDLEAVTKDRDLVGQVSLRRLAEIRQLQAEKQRLIANNIELQGELYIHRSEALVRDAEQIVKGES